MESTDRQIKTVMHELKKRVLTVKKTEMVTSKIKRVTLTGSDLKGFTSLSPDDHIKIFFPYPGETEPVVPSMNPNEPPTDSRPPLMRDYTPLSFNAEKEELEIEFVLHEKGPGTTWATQAQAGHKLHMAGPRGSKIVPYAFDWYLMIGDETALPSISRRLKELPSLAPAIVVIEVADASQVYPLQAAEPHQQIHWVFRENQTPGDSQKLRNKLLEIPFPLGDYFSWVACEKKAAMDLKGSSLTVKGAREDWVKATGYWNRER